LRTLQTAACPCECCSLLPLQTMLMVVCLNTADSYLSMGTLHTVVGPCEHYRQLSAIGNAAHPCLCKHCWCLSVLVNTADSCLWEHCRQLSVHGNTIDGVNMADGCISLWMLLSAVCGRGICCYIALAGRWHTKNRNLVELYPFPPIHLKTVWVRWLAYKDWTLPSGNNVLWLWILFISHAGKYWVPENCLSFRSISP
jgi:hypothetical protein